MSPPEWTNWQHTTLAPDPQEYVVREAPPMLRPDVPVNPPQQGFNNTHWTPGDGWADPQPSWLCGPNRAPAPRAGQPMEITDDEPEPK